MPIRSLLAALGLQAKSAEAQEDPFFGNLQRQLQHLGGDRVEYLAAFAGQLARVADADDGISDSEAESIACLLEKQAGLSPSEARLVADIARRHFAALRETREYLLNRIVNAHATAPEKEQLVDCLYAVAAADHLVSDLEEQAIRQVASSLMLSHRTLMDIRARYKDQLEVLQNNAQQRRPTGP